MENMIVILTISTAACWTALANDDAPSPLAAPDNGLLLEYLFDTNTNDSSGRDHHGRIHGEPHFVNEDGRAALAFDGSGDWVESTSGFVLPATEYSIEFWVKPAAQQSPYAGILGNQMATGQGFVFQQDANNTNSYTFTYNTITGGWVATRPIKLAVDHWQHIAIIKSPVDLKLYLNGVLLDKVQAIAVINSSSLDLRVGLSFVDENRCFNGAIFGLRIWDRALNVMNPDVSMDQKTEALANNTSVHLSTANPSRIFDSANPPVVDLRFGDGLEIEGTGVIRCTFECVDSTGDLIDLAPVELSPADSYKESIILSLPAGYYRLTCKSTLSTPGGEYIMNPVAIGFSVLADTYMESQTTPAPVFATIGTQPTIITSLDGEGWLLATDPRNTGRTGQWFKKPTADAKPTRTPWII